MTIFVKGKQKRVKRPPTIEGMNVDDFIRANADPIWLHQNELWEYMDIEGEETRDPGEAEQTASTDGGPAGHSARKLGSRLARRG